MNVNINEEEPKLTLEEQKMRSKHSFAGDKKNTKNIYFVFRLTQHLDPSCDDRDQAGVD